MKSIYGSLSLIAMVLYFDCISPADSNVGNTPAMENLLSTQQAQIYSKIYETTGKCNDIVPVEEAMKLFQPNPQFLPLNKPANCYIDCVLREMGVKIDNVIHVDKYLTIVKEMLSNYKGTSFVDEWEKSSYNSAVKSFDVNYEFIKVYEKAALECQGDPTEVDSCESGFRFVECILENGRKEYPDMAIFPLSPTRVSDSISDTSLVAKSRSKRFLRTPSLILRFG